MAFQRYAFGIIFTIKADGKIVFLSYVIRGTERPSYDLDLSGVKTLELQVDKAFERNGGHWGLWLEPTLFRESKTNTNTPPAGSR